MKKSNKCYNYADLKDLQSKLALVAGDKRKEKNETILRFNAVSSLIIIFKFDGLKPICLMAQNIVFSFDGQNPPAVY